MSTDIPTDAVEHDYPVIRPEGADGEDVGAIHALTAEAFATVDHASGTESAIIDALREADALTVSLVAVHAGRIVGHVAASPVTLDPPAEGWFGLGPLSVHPEFQRQGVGSALVKAVVDALVDQDATGAVLLGDPGLYERFGFAARDGLTMEGLDPDNAAFFQALRLDVIDDADAAANGQAGDASYPRAVVTYHPGFDAS
ncbi:MAG TPA: N-acetyltransferase [Candidatus Corynebacterium avicola]|uniref:N-acetyltransferase n=1 Tax=Candidatus Corynebacterium avicola TaxID=2838527 RepID=A0A9D1UJY6_9CORY|nr:N-acetyltransferase [Candidatus Corynebacterium avicola]